MKGRRGTAVDKPSGTTNDEVVLREGWH